MVRSATEETRLPTSALAADRKKMLAQPGRIPQHAGIPGMARARVSGWRFRDERGRMVAARLHEVDECVDGAGRYWPNELSAAGNAPRSIYQKRGMDDSRKIFVLRDRDAAPDRR